MRIKKKNNKKDQKESLEENVDSLPIQYNCPPPKKKNKLLGILLLRQRKKKDEVKYCLFHYIFESSIFNIRLVYFSLTVITSTENPET